MHKLTLWLGAFRPRTLGAALAPVAMGVAWAAAHGTRQWMLAVLVLLSALLIQIGTNLANDYFDFRKGADTAERIGPRRLSQSGLMSPRDVRRAFVLAFALAVAIGAVLLARGGLPIFVIGVLAVAFGVLYTGGPFPLAYNGLGDVFAFVFFGPVAVAGTVWVLALEWVPRAALAGVGPGLLSAALLVVNNLRDREQDRVARKRTLVVRFGVGYARSQYMVCLVGAALIPVFQVWTGAAGPALLLASASILLALPAARLVLTAQGPILNQALAGTGKTLLLYGLAWSVGILV
ncbi:MAG: 1,4-dihydroxy-2-naphthoate polyprenyltransferase [Candidatus Delongbacteria bacterium]|nr:1,4-dihydroxy-2-naphthoate polyprenyltransferase [Candidatus Cloacimonadota bacterium]MCA9787202.1 1,4-dihydroxy-2-naphthoate polyprenyltransferase [Candidatus Cloacimonadota bacterium]MCB9473303.1 1,4-dihydroxy-2-naphthoate polyprenyltransferase [Candidatus Delongbacteria bacterium]